jgi:hypothetical protein
MSSPYDPYARMLWSLTNTGKGTDLSGAGSANSGKIDLKFVTDVWVSVFAAGTSSGTSPTLDVQLDVYDAQGNLIPQVAKITQLTAGPGRAAFSAGLHIAGAGSMVLPRHGQITWTLGGTSPAFPGVEICVYGR